MLQAQQNLVNPSVNDSESIVLLLNNQNKGHGEDGQSNPAADSIPNIGIPARIGSPILPHADSDVFLKVSASPVPELD